MTFLKKVYIVASSIPGFNFGMLICLMLLSFVMGIALSFFDSATLRLYFEYAPVGALGYNLVFVSFFMFLMGYLYHIYSHDNVQLT